MLRLVVEVKYGDGEWESLGGCTAHGGAQPDERGDPIPTTWFMRDLKGVGTDRMVRGRVECLGPSLDLRAEADFSVTPAVVKLPDLHNSVAFDDVASASAGGVDSLTIGSVACSGSDRAMCVIAHGVESTGSGAATDSVVRGGSETFTEGFDAPAGSRVHASGHYFVAPATAAADVVITYSEHLGRAGFGTAISMTGVDQTTPVSDSATDTPGSTAESVSVTLTSDTDELVVGGVALNDTTAVTLGADQTVRSDNTENGRRATVSTEVGASSVTHSYSWTGASWCAMGALAFKAASGTAPTSLVHHSRSQRGMAVR